MGPIGIQMKKQDLLTQIKLGKTLSDRRYNEEYCKLPLVEQVSNDA